MASAARDHDSAGARFALQRGQSLLADGDQAAGQRWLDRAHRLLPDDPTVALVRAAGLLGYDRAACRTAVAALLERTASPEAHALLVACEVLDGRWPQARAALASLLGRHPPPASADFRRLADQVAREGGAPGWLGMDVAGVAAVVRVATGSARIELTLDGAQLGLPRPAKGLSTVALPEHWRRAGQLAATWRGVHLIGSPLPLASFAAVQGVVGPTAEGGLDGWASYPADPAASVVLTLHLHGEPQDPPATRTVVATPGGARQGGFRIDAAELPARGVARLVGPDGRDLAGSPVAFGGEAAARHAAAARLGRLYGLAPSGEAWAETPDPWRPLPAAEKPSAWRTATPAEARAIDVVIPVFRGAADFVACLASLRGQLGAADRIAVIDDASPDAALRQAVARAEAAGEVTVVRHADNRGFPAAANAGLRLAVAAGHDVLLLNSDTILPAGALARLARAARAAPDIGSVTPMTNDGTILSYPRTDAANPVPDAVAVRRLDALFAAAHGAAVVDIPTAVGFCMFVRHDCLSEVGGLREDVFAQGYGEENDWCLRAAHLGWRHVAAAGVFVGHVGGRSFGPAKAQLIARNIGVLNRLHPGYDAMIADFVARDPLGPIRRAVDEARWRLGRRTAGATVLVTHNRGGGVARHVRERGAAIVADGRRAIVVHPGPTPETCVVGDPADESLANLAYAMPAEMDALAALLRHDGVAEVELHHTIGHAPSILGLADALRVPLDIVAHDYAHWCPRVTLVSYGDRYCGEPARVEECIACVADLGERARETVGVVALRARSAALVASARRVVVPSADTAKRFRRHFPGSAPEVRAWETATPRGPATQPATGVTRIVVPGAIGVDKGYDVVLACARDAARRGLPIEFVIVGHTADDARLIDTGRVFVTGRYAEAEGEALIRAQGAALGFIPSIWPETWCYTLSLAWAAGLRVAAFDIGAQAERIRAAGGGLLLPLGLPPSRINDALLAFSPRSSPSPLEGEGRGEG